jgi:hypothetical protein
VEEGGSFGAGVTGEVTNAKLLPLEADAVESVSLEAAAVKTTAVDVDVAKPPHRPLHKMPSA